VEITQYLLIFGLGLLPSVVWLIFFDLEEAERFQPIRDVLYAFLVGAVSTFVALLAQMALLRLMPGWGISPHDTYGVSIFAFVEELVKFSAVFFLVSRRTSFSKPLDAMIYMITVALGFAAVENIASLINQGGLEAAITSAKSIEVVVLRFLGATLLHSVTAGIIGFHWAVGWVRGRLVWLHILIGILVAGLLHSVFNYLILTTGPASWALAFVATIAFFVLIDFEELRTEEEAQERAGILLTKP
jgi:protease PrsW